MIIKHFYSDLFQPLSCWPRIYPAFAKCRSRSVGFFRSQLIWIYTVTLSMWIYINHLDQVIWLAENWKWAWHLNLFSMTRFNAWQAGYFVNTLLPVMTTAPLESAEVAEWHRNYFMINLHKGYMWLHWDFRFRNLDLQLGALPTVLWNPVQEALNHHPTTLLCLHNYKD